jgi:hypothetical protein
MTNFSHWTDALVERNITKINLFISAVINVALTFTVIFIVNIHNFIVEKPS